jgi:hypothetical protein
MIIVSGIEIPYSVYANKWQPVSPGSSEVELDDEEKEIASFSEYDDEGSLPNASARSVTVMLTASQSSDPGAAKKTPPLKTRSATKKVKGKGKEVSNRAKMDLERKYLLTLSCRTQNHGYLLYFSDHNRLRSRP